MALKTCCLSWFFLSQLHLTIVWITKRTWKQSLAVHWHRAIANGNHNEGLLFSSQTINASKKNRQTSIYASMVNISVNYNSLNKHDLASERYCPSYRATRHYADADINRAEFYSLMWIPGVLLTVTRNFMIETMSNRPTMFITYVISK